MKGAVVQLLAVIIAIIMISGCAKEPSGASATAQSDSQQLQPQQAALAEIYNRSCRNCHTIAATGAPLTGDVEGWSPRMAKGMDTLVNNVVDGYGGMPPFGMCMDCGIEEFEALINFMALATAGDGTPGD